MVKYERYCLDNGLTVLLHQDKTTPMVVVNTLYNVGARDEDETKTGFAHLFEHLMFGGSINVEDFDAPLQNAGGESNAFTSNDITNYYNTLPKENIETALWLESDRMLSLGFTGQKLGGSAQCCYRRIQTTLFEPTLWKGMVAHETFDLQGTSLSMGDHWKRNRTY